MTAKQTMQKGERVVYRCLAGWRCDAVVMRVNPKPPKMPGGRLSFDGSLDIEVDTGAEPMPLIRIELVPVEQLEPGTCCRRDDAEAEKN